MPYSKGQSHVDFLLSKEIALSSATKRQLAIVKDSPSLTNKTLANEKNMRNDMLVSVCSYLELQLPPPPHFHQRGFRETELTVWRAIRNALVHHGGDLRKAERPNDAELITHNFLQECINENEVDADGKKVSPYFTINSAGIVELDAHVYFRVRKLAFDLLVHSGEIVV